MNAISKLLSKIKGGASIETLKANRDIEGLSDALTSSKNPSIRKSAVRALEELGGAEAAKSLIKGLMDKDNEVLNAINGALAHIGEPAVELLISEAFQADAFSVNNERYRSRKAAQEALKKMGTPATKFLIAKLADSNEWVRKDAADILVTIGKPTVESLSSVIAKSENWCAVQAAVWALGEIGDEEVVELMIAVLKDEKHKSNSIDEDQAVRQTAVSILGRKGDKRAIRPLISVLADRHDHRFVHSSAADALEKIGTPEAKAAASRWRKISGIYHARSGT